MLNGLTSKNFREKSVRFLGWKHYIPYAKEQLLLRWSQLSRLSKYDPKINTQLIQPYDELDQFFVFIEPNLPLIKTLKSRYLANKRHDTVAWGLCVECLQNDLFSQWKTPDTIRNSISIWDNIVTN